MRELVGSKNTKGQMASVLKKLQKATFTFPRGWLGSTRTYQKGYVNIYNLVNIVRPCFAHACFRLFFFCLIAIASPQHFLICFHIFDLLAFGWFLCFLYQPCIFLREYHFLLMPTFSGMQLQCKTRTLCTCTCRICGISFLYFY